MLKSAQTRVRGRLVGYARVSTIEQNLDMQVEALVRSGVARRDVLVEKVSASNKKRPQLDWALTQLRQGDTLVVWKLDRVARSLVDMLNRLRIIEDHGAGFKSLTEEIDTNTPAGKLMLHMLGALAQFERDLVVQRTKAGVAAAQARGVKFGQPKKMSDDQIAQCRKWRKEGKTIREVQALVKSEYNIKVSPQTILVRTRGKR